MGVPTSKYWAAFGYVMVAFIVLDLLCLGSGSECGERDLGDFGVGIHCPSCSSKTALG
jgi:hypothetical protein